MVFASHDLDKVAEECSRAVWLQAGGVRSAGDAATVVGEYREAMRSDTIERTPAPGDGPDGALELRRNRFGTQELQIVRVEVLDGDGVPTREVATGDPLRIVLELRGEHTIDEPIIGIVGAPRRRRRGVLGRQHGDGRRAAGERRAPPSRSRSTAST